MSTLRRTAATDSLPTVSRVAVPDASAPLGAVVWTVAVLAGGLGTVPRALPMSLALGYGVATFSGLDLGLDIAMMVALHGSLNAFGFALGALVGWRLDVP